MPWLERLAYDEWNQAKLERFQNELISCIPMQQFTFIDAIKTTYPWEMESNNSLKNQEGEPTWTLVLNPYKTKFSSFPQDVLVI